MPHLLFLNHNQENFGTYFRCYNLALHLSQKGYRITMVCASGKNFDLLIRRHQINPRFSIITLPRLKYHQFFTGQIFLRLPLTIALVLLLPYDICHAFTVAQIQIGLPAAIAKLIRRRPLVVDWDDCWGRGFAKEHHPLVGHFINWSETFFIKFADHITYVSEFIKNEIDSHPHLQNIPKTKIINGANIKNIKIIHQSAAKKKLKLNPRFQYLLSMGNTYTASLSILIKAFKLILTQKPKTKLILLGEDNFPPSIKKNKNIIIAGKKPFNQVSTYLSAADCLLLPMDNNNVEKARFPMRFGDYLCAKKPIVANAVGEVRYYLQKYRLGLATPVNNHRIMAQKTIFILNHPAQAKKYGLTAYKFAQKHFSWDKITKSLIYIYENTLSQSAIPSSHRQLH